MLLILINILLCESVKNITQTQVEIQISVKIGYG